MTSEKKQSGQVFQLLGKAIAQRPAKIRQLLDKYSVPIRQGNDAQALIDGVLFALERKGKDFQKDLSTLLESDDNFLGAIAGAVGAVAGAVKGNQEAKAAKAQAKAQTLSAIFAYKAQQDASRIEELKIRSQQSQAQQKAPQVKKQNPLSSNTILIIAGVVVALIIIALAFNQMKKQNSALPQQVIQSR